MQRRLIKDSEDNVVVWLSNDDNVPAGYELVPEEDLASEEILLARKNKMAEIRIERDRRLLENDKLWLIAKKTNQDASELEAAAQELRDLPEAAELALEELETVEEIKAYSPFEE